MRPPVRPSPSVESCDWLRRTAFESGGARNDLRERETTPSSPQSSGCSASPSSPLVKPFKATMFAGELKECVEVSLEILKIMASGNSGIKKTCDKQELILDRMLETEASAMEIMKDFYAMETEAAQRLMGFADERQRYASQLSKIEQEFHQACEQSAFLESDIQFLKKELEDLKEMEAEVQHMEEEVNEDTTEVIPSAQYLAQLYHKVTKIDWDYSCEPTLVKGIHYGGEVAQPINMDSTQHTKTFISNSLWGLLSTEW